MTPASVGPLSRPVRVDRLPPAATEIVVEANAEERAALARDFGLPAIAALVGRFRLAGSLHRVAVTGRVRAELTQTCVVSLEAFDVVVDEEVDVDFAAAEAFRGTPAEDADLTDPIVDGTIDLGSLTAEFLALGLDPHPRKPGIAYEPPPEEPDPSPFAVLGRLKGGLE